MYIFGMGFFDRIMWVGLTVVIVIAVLYTIRMKDKALRLSFIGGIIAGVSFMFYAQDLYSQVYKDGIGQAGYLGPTPAYLYALAMIVGITFFLVGVSRKMKAKATRSAGKRPAKEPKVSSASSGSPVPGFQDAS